MYDLLIVGLGVYGASIAAEAGDRGLSVIAIDQYDAPNSHGSSGGSSRIFRLTTVEDDAYVPRARRALDLWKAYDAEVEGRLIVPMGLAIIAERGASKRTHHGVDELVNRARAIARRHAIDHEVMSGAELTRRHPSLAVSPDNQVYYEPGAFVLRPDVAIEAMLRRATRSGRVELLTGQPVGTVELAPQGVRTKIGDRIIHARQAIFCTGPWQHKDLIGRNVVSARVKPQVSLRVLGSSVNRKLDFPAFVHIPRSGPLTYAVASAPELDEVKMGMEQGNVSLGGPDPRLLPSDFMDDSVRAIEQSIKGLLPGVSLDGARADLCYYTVTENSKHVVRHVDKAGKLTVISACSGHGFKFAPALAEEVVSHLDRSSAKRG